MEAVINRHLEGLLFNETTSDSLVECKSNYSRLCGPDEEQSSGQNQLDYKSLGVSSSWWEGKHFDVVLRPFYTTGTFSI